MRAGGRKGFFPNPDGDGARLCRVPAFRAVPPAFAGSQDLGLESQSKEGDPDPAGKERAMQGKA